jgi:hypothetical protein
MEERGFDMQCGIDSSKVALAPDDRNLLCKTEYPCQNNRSLVLAIFLQWLGLFRQLGFVA